MESRNMNKQMDREGVKKPYGSPELIMYGDIRQITRTNDDKGNADGGMGMTDKS
jgi:hypothetical protein